MTEWLKEIAERKRREMEERSVRERKALSDRELIRAGAAAAWAEIQCIAEDARRVLADDLGAENVFRLRLDGGKLLFLARSGGEIYRLVFHEMFAQLATPDGSYRMGVQGANLLIWNPDPDDNTGATSTRSLAETAVTRAMRRI